MTTYASAGPDRPAVFVSYSHEDTEWLQDLLTMLAPVVRSGAVRVWSDGEIAPSDPWRAEIEAAMAAAQVAVLLSSTMSSCRTSWRSTKRAG
jgi:internalin A